MSLATPASDALEANALARILGPNLLTLAFPGLLQFFNAHQFNGPGIAELEQGFGIFFLRNLVVVLEVEGFFSGEAFEAPAILNSGQQGPRRDVVNSRNHRVVQAASEFFGFVLRARPPDDRGRGAEKTNSRVFEGLNEICVLGHEAIARKYVGVVVVPRDLHDLGDALNLFLLAGTHVVGHSVDVGGE